MNRSIALFVALAVLAAHSFAIHSDGEGGLAAPYDRASAAFRLARNLVHQGRLAWFPGEPGLHAYPSLLWVALCSLAERFQIGGINNFAQSAGMLFALATVVVASRFHPDRTASLIAPLLLAISGGLAAAAVSGLETTLVAFLLTASFLTFERGRSPTFALCLAALGLARPEGWIMVGAFFVLRLLPAGAARRLGEPVETEVPPRPQRRVAPSAFLVPVAAFVLLGLGGQAQTGNFLGPDLRRLLAPEPGDLAAGLASLWDFARVAASPLLVLYALWYLGRGYLTATGTRALALAGTWIVLVVLTGGGKLPFYESFVPALPVLLIAAQEGMINALNSLRRPVRGFAWCTFLGAVVISALGSRSPADVGPIPLGEWQRRWLEPSDPRLHQGLPGMPHALGREGLEVELRFTRHLRAVGVFLRNQLAPDATLLTPWPGAIGYISRLPVRDLLGRATPVREGQDSRPWDATHRVDLLTAFSSEPGYLFLTLESGMRAPTPAGLAAELLLAFDIDPRQEARLTQLSELLSRYELVTVPIAAVEQLRVPLDDERAYLLRRRDLELAPRIALVHDEGAVSVTMRHKGHIQLAELRVIGRDAHGNVWHLDPAGRFVRRPVLARTHLLVHGTGEREIELIRAPLPRDMPVLVELEAVLVNPGVTVHPQPFSPVSAEARLPLR